MTISSISNIQKPLTPKELLKKFEQGERPEYEHRDDKLQAELETLAQQYRQTLSLDKKIELLAKERDLMYQELEEPEFVLARNYEQVKNVISKDIQGQDVEDILRLFSITGINRNENLNGVFAHKSPASRVDELEKVYLQLNEDTTIGIRGRDFVIRILNALNVYNPELESKIIQTFDNLLENTKNVELRENIQDSTPKFDKEAILESLKKHENQNFLFKNLLHKAKHNDKEITEFVNTILNSENVDADFYNTAVWGAGCQRSDENFEIIKKIALNKKERNIRRREFAIHSVALYLKDKPEEVKEIITAIKNEKSIFTDLGKILYDKIHGNYHGQKNRELKYANLNDKQIEHFQKQVKKFLKTEKPLTIQQENACHRATLPYRKILNKLIRDNFKYILLEDTLTKLSLEDAGKRYIQRHAGILNSGDYYDAFDGMSMEKYNMLSFNRVVNSQHTNIMAHETAHILNRLFDHNDMAKLEELYNKALKKKRALDIYAISNKSEYFAQGCQAFVTVYHPHKVINQNGTYEHTRYELMAKDPDLYKFIEKIFKEYQLFKLG